MDQKAHSTFDPRASSYSVSPWSNSKWKRICDLGGALFLIVVLSPIMALVALVVKLTSPGPILFRQRRPGKNGIEFSIYKFRTMVDKPGDTGPACTRADDPRVTSCGRSIRKWKLDELPQLFNVLRGEMSFVGPRPLPTKLWQQPSVQQEAQVVLSVRPGITSQATLNFRNEEELLAPLSSEDVEHVYRRVILPSKVKMELVYLANASFKSDLIIILQTGLRVLNRREKLNFTLIKDQLPFVSQIGGGHAEPELDVPAGSQTVPQANSQRR